MTPATNPTWGGRRVPGPGKRLGPPRVYTSPARRFSITLSVDEIAWLDAQAQAAGQSRADVIRRLIQKERTAEPNVTYIYIRPRDRSLAEYKAWMMWLLERSTDAEGDIMSEEDWERAWREFWAGAPAEEER